MPFTKFRGIRLQRKKDASLLNTLKRPFAPKRIQVPLYGGPGVEVVPHVKEGECVQAGQKIATPKGPDGVPVYTGMAGKVKKISTITLPDWQECMSVEIVSEKDNKPTPRYADTRKDAEKISGEELLRIFREQGLLTADEKMEPVHVKARKKTPVKTVVINCCEPEPYVTSQQALITSHAVEILKGAELLKKACDAKKIIFIFEDTNREEYELIRSKIYLLKLDFCEAIMIPAVYPESREEILLKKFSGGATVWNVTTTYAVYEAVYLQKPFFERIVTVGGECVVEPRNLWLPLGFLFQDAIRTCKGFLREPRKVIAGGPMTGFAQTRLDVPITAGTDAVLALPGEIAKATNERPCVRCNRCVDCCPVSISPAMITIAAERNEFEVAEEWGVGDCIECGACSYVCPSERPMSELIRLAKQKTRGQK